MTTLIKWDEKTNEDVESINMLNIAEFITNEKYYPQVTKTRLTHRRFLRGSNVYIKRKTNEPFTLYEYQSTQLSVLIEKIKFLCTEWSYIKIILDGVVLSSYYKECCIDDNEVVIYLPGLKTDDTITIECNIDTDIIILCSIDIDSSKLSLGGEMHTIEHVYKRNTMYTDNELVLPNQHISRIYVHCDDEDATLLVVDNNYHIVNLIKLKHFEKFKDNVYLCKIGIDEYAIGYGAIGTVAIMVDTPSPVKIICEEVAVMRRVLKNHNIDESSSSDLIDEDIDDSPMIVI